MLMFQLIAVDELKNDYRNPVDFCQGLNKVYTSLYKQTKIVSVSLFHLQEGKVTLSVMWMRYL